MEKLFFRNQDKVVRMMDILFPGCTIYLFGSYARGDQKQSSDIDLVIDAGKLLAPHETGQALNIIEDLNVLRKVDLVDWNLDLSDKFRNIIKEEGIKIWPLSKE